MKIFNYTAKLHQLVVKSKQISCKFAMQLQICIETISLFPETMPKTPSLLYF